MFSNYGSGGVGQVNFYGNEKSQTPTMSFPRPHPTNQFQGFYPGFPYMTVQMPMYPGAPNLNQPAQVQPAQVQPAQVQPAQAQPAQIQPAHPQPTQAQSVHPQLAQAQPAQAHLEQAQSEQPQRTKRAAPNPKKCLTPYTTYLD